MRHGEILTFDVRANLFGIGFTDDWDQLRTHHFRRGVAAFTLGSSAVFHCDETIGISIVRVVAFL